MKAATNEFFLQVSQDFLKESFGKIEEAVSRLDEREIWARPHDATNAIGNLLLHLEGNVRQHIISGCCGAPDVRKRSSEFAAKEGARKAELLAALARTVDEACDALARLDPGQLLERRVIQNKEVVLLADIYHVVEHFSYHTGQIVQRVKDVTGRGFGWYASLEGT